MEESIWIDAGDASGLQRDIVDATDSGICEEIRDLPTGPTLGRLISGADSKGRSIDPAVSGA